MTIKEFLNNPIQGMVMLDKNTTLMIVGRKSPH